MIVFMKKGKLNFRLNESRNIPNFVKIIKLNLKKWGCYKLRGKKERNFL